MLDERGPVARAGYRSPHRPDAARLATGELGYHGQEGYRTRHYDAARLVPLPTHERPNGSVFDGERQHPEYDPAYPAGYETASTGFIMVGAREYDPEIGRFLEPDPRPTSPELQWGQLNRWAYCANDPVNASDPSGEYTHLLGVLFGLVGFGLQIASAFMEPGTTANLLNIAGGILIAVGTLMIGNLGGLVKAGQQLSMLMTAALARVLPFLAFLLAMILGFADACTRQAARSVRTLTQFMDFAASLWSRYAMSAEPDGVRVSFPIRLESSWLLTRQKAA